MIKPGAKGHKYISEVNFRDGKDTGARRETGKDGGKEKKREKGKDRERKERESKKNEGEGVKKKVI